MRTLTPSLLLAVLALPGCAWLAQPEQNAEQLRQLTAARQCDARLPFFGYYRYSRDEMLQYAFPDASIAMGNDGGWCAIRYQAMSPSGGFTVSKADVTTPPSHGSVLVGTLDGLLQIAYRPAPGYRGEDAFAIELRGPFPYNVPVRVRVRVE